MRVLLVCEDLPAQAVGGLGKHVVALGNALLRAGHEVALMGRDRPSIDDCRAEVDFDGRFLVGFPDPWQSWGERRFGVFHPWKRHHYARRIAQAIRSTARHFDVVHYHGHLPLVGRWLGPEVPFLQTRHDQGSDCIIHLRYRPDGVCHEQDPAACARCAHPHPGPLRTAISRWTVERYRHANAAAFVAHPVVFVSAFLRDAYARGAPPAALKGAHVVHNFLDESSLAALRPVPRGTEAPHYLLHVAGRLEPAKGVARLLELLVPRLPPRWSVQVYGDGPQGPELRRRYAAAEVRFAGHRPADEVLRAAASADCCVVPSECEESFGFVTLEALRLGRVCMALDRGATPELAAYGAPRQLRLYPSLEALVDDLLVNPPQSTVASHATSATEGLSADIGARVPELLALYEQVRAGRRTSREP